MMEGLDFKEYENAVKETLKKKREIVQNWILKNEQTSK